jgi:hypothetical protein
MQLESFHPARVISYPVVECSGHFQRLKRYLHRFVYSVVVWKKFKKPVMKKL